MVHLLPGEVGLPEDAKYLTDLGLTDPASEVNALRRRDVEGHEGKEYSQINTPLGPLPDVIRMFGKPALEEFVQGTYGVLGHRFFPYVDEKGGVHPENSWGAARNNISYGISGAETDVVPNYTDDDVYVFHDRTGGRWTAQMVLAEYMTHEPRTELVMRAHDLERGRFGVILQNTGEFVMNIAKLAELCHQLDAHSKAQLWDLKIRVILDCRDSSAPQTIRQVMRLAKEDRDFFYIQLLNFCIKDFADLKKQVDDLGVKGQWWNELAYIISPNLDGLSVIAGVKHEELRVGLHLESNKTWVKDLADNLRTVALHAPRNGAAEDLENGTGPFKIATLADKDLHIFHADAISKALQLYWREIRPNQPTMSPSPAPTITRNNEHYASTWTDPMRIVKMDPQNRPRDYYSLQSADAARHCIDWNADYVLTDNIPNTCYQLAMHAAKFNQAHLYRNRIQF
ncbi:hypothetical protein JR316_0009503 [Psilocybe cubensis]|uniref:Uncharacterized protein n=2 Tax=Psilocybe cubensis TaxID=181762 RepID=A0ACB8GPB8_PSICU|nr:hypothetical protein JR316_0009503 [Psilocybe cubensis]KAH9477299.1 hypothetical protein JR316_0009503 [Psilocybe cubensis]